MRKSEYLRRKPDPTVPFKWMDDWARVPETQLDAEACALYVAKRKGDYCNLKGVARRQSSKEFLAFLRYDYKKVLILTRYLYIDRLRKDEYTISASDDLDFAFFEPILHCFPCLEFIGRLAFSDDVDWSPEVPKTAIVLRNVLEDMGDGYKDCAANLITFHRHAIAHELRPDGQWKYDLNTEDKYGPPKQIDGGMLYLNIPHFIDASLLEMEKLCDRLSDSRADDLMEKLSMYVNRRFK